MNLTDPHKIYPSLDGDNFSVDAAKQHKELKTAYREIPLTIECDKPGWEPHLFIHVALQHFVSNILALDFKDEPVISCYMDSQPFSIDFLDEDDE